jgi:hypothetical protein
MAAQGPRWSDRAVEILNEKGIPVNEAEQLLSKVSLEEKDIKDNNNVVFWYYPFFSGGALLQFFDEDNKEYVGFEVEDCKVEVDRKNCYLAVPQLPSVELIPDAIGILNRWMFIVTGHKPEWEEKRYGLGFYHVCKLFWADFSCVDRFGKGVQNQKWLATQILLHLFTILKKVSLKVTLTSEKARSLFSGPYGSETSLDAIGDCWASRVSHGKSYYLTCSNVEIDGKLHFTCSTCFGAVTIIAPRGSGLRDLKKLAANGVMYFIFKRIGHLFGIGCDKGSYIDLRWLKFRYSLESGERNLTIIRE